MSISLDQMTYILPAVIMVEAFLATVPLALAGRWGSALYFLSAGFITLGVMLIPKWG